SLNFDAIVDDSASLGDGITVLVNWPKGVPKPHVGLIQDFGTNPYRTKYKKFLISNVFSYEYFDIQASSWIKEAEKFDVIIWRPASSISALDEARRKIYFLE